MGLGGDDDGMCIFLDGCGEGGGGDEGGESPPWELGLHNCEPIDDTCVLGRQTCIPRSRRAYIFWTSPKKFDAYFLNMKTMKLISVRDLTAPGLV